MTVEFESLRNVTPDGEFEIFDLPGVGEYVESHFGFQELINLVGQEVSAIIPIVSLKEVSKNDWSTALPKILRDTTGLEEPPLIVCTHLDQVETPEHVNALIERVLSEFSSQSNDLKVECVACSSRLGLGAQILLKMSQEGKPTYDNLFDENVPEPCRACAKHILGSSEKLARRSLRSLTDEDWRIALEETVVESGLEETVVRITRDVVGNAHSETLRRSLKSTALQFHKASLFHSSILLKMQHSREEAEELRDTFREAQRQIALVQESWDKEEQELRSNAKMRIENLLTELETRLTVKAKENYEDVKQVFILTHTEYEDYTKSEGQIRFCHWRSSEIVVQDVLKRMKRELELDMQAIVLKLQHETFREEITVQLNTLTSVIKNKLGKDDFAVDKMVVETNYVNGAIEDLDPIDFSIQVSYVEIQAGLCFSDEYTLIREETLLQELYEQMIRPSVASLRVSAESALERTMQVGRTAAKSAIAQFLHDEEMKFKLELSKRRREPSQMEVASTVAAYLNFVSAEAAMQELEKQISTRRLR
ncbi:hypothetical protein DFH11DRAFT_1763226 [Phellopilus nigrolimitatus]|nr:hypothetical protein DFH11DRAFT_1763226 [Phellopilus nigrolimitatus]